MPRSIPERISRIYQHPRNRAKTLFQQQEPVSGSFSSARDAQAIRKRTHDDFPAYGSDTDDDSSPTWTLQHEPG
ncbi:hypothetical protein BM1_04930 [Bipolaris maydis]|nr:hypothetical protein BM1_04930 [Bipolaris maydis]